MDPIVGVDFLQGDFRDELVLKALLERVGDSKVQVVMSDMAPNMCGTPAVDIPRAMYLVELALEMSRDVLAPGGSFVVKVFQGEGFDEYVLRTAADPGPGHRAAVQAPGAGAASGGKAQAVPPDDGGCGAILYERRFYSLSRGIYELRRNQRI